MDALELLRLDHERMRELFRVMESTFDERLHRMLFAQIRNELSHHCHVKESIFYPLFERYPELTKAIHKAYSDHRKLRIALNRISRSLSDGDWRRFKRYFGEMMDTVERHIDCEETEIFPVIARILPDRERARLGLHMQRMLDRLNPATAA